MKIFHAADIHLGRRRLDGRLPDQDFADAFAFVAGKAVQEQADVLVIAGDLFDRPQVEPPHLRQAQQVLWKLKQARIPVIAIEGNHDKASVQSEDPSWLHYLAEDELLILLRTRFDSTGPLLTRWEDHMRGGAYYDLNGVRFVGIGYLGAATPYKVRQIATSLATGQTHVVLLHAGPEYFTGEGGGFSSEDLELLRQKVCYLALGHIHKPMVHGGADGSPWACNPGSPENCDLREAAYDRDRNGNEQARGYAVVEIDPQQGKQPVSIAVRSNPRRPCQRLKLDCTPFGAKAKEGAFLIAAAAKQIREAGFSPETVVELALCGKLDLNRFALDQMCFGSEIEKASGVFAVALQLGELNVEALTQSAETIPDGLSREELEKDAIRGLVEGKHLWGLEGLEADFAELFYQLKEGVKAGLSGEELADKIGQDPLVEMIQKSLQGGSLQRV